MVAAHAGINLCGILAAIRSSVMEMAGNRIRMTSARATNWALRFEPVRGPKRAQTQSIHAAKTAQPRLRMSSILSANFTSDMDGSRKRLLTVDY